MRCDAGSGLPWTPEWHAGDKDAIRMPASVLYGMRTITDPNWIDSAASTGED
jgi:hypothetical protein